MSPILDLQQRITERGRIRLGTKVEGTRRDGSTYTRPAKSRTFLVSSHDRTIVEEAAAEWADTAGEVEVFDGGFRVDTGRTELDVILPPAMMSFSQWREMWGNRVCHRRCDGARETISDGPCLCPADHEERAALAQSGKACKDTTRLSVMLPDLPGFGLWRVESHGFYAATELAGAVQAVTHLAPNTLVRARLVAAEREVVRFDGDGQPKTHKFVVPVLDLPDVRLRELIAPDGGVGVQIEAPARPSLTPVAPAALTETTGLSVAEQLAQTKETPRRRSNAAAVLPSTGLEPGAPVPALATPEQVARIDALLPQVPEEAMPGLKAWKAQQGISMKAGEFTAEAADLVVGKLEELVSSSQGGESPRPALGVSHAGDDTPTGFQDGEVTTVPVSSSAASPEPGGETEPDERAAVEEPQTAPTSAAPSGPATLKATNYKAYLTLNRYCRKVQGEHFTADDPKDRKAQPQWDALVWQCSGGRTTHLAELTPDEASDFRRRCQDVANGLARWVESDDASHLGWTFDLSGMEGAA